MERLPDQHHEMKWTANASNTSWTMHMWPLYLTVDYRPRESLPYVGTLAGRTVVKRDHYSWATAEEAAIGMLDWAMFELSTTYHELLKLRTQET
jgi:hypothetical protein